MFTFDAFNLLNHRYFTSVQPSIYRIDGNGVGILNPRPGYGAGTAAVGFPDGTCPPLQLGLRFIW